MNQNDWGKLVDLCTKAYNEFEDKIASPLSTERQFKRAIEDIREIPTEYGRDLASVHTFGRVWREIEEVLPN